MTEISFRFNSCRDETSFYNNQVGKIAESAESNDNEGRNASDLLLLILSQNAFNLN